MGTWRLRSGLAGGWNVAGRRAAKGRSARRSGSAPAVRWAARCRPSRSGRTPPCRASAGTGRPGRCGCTRRRVRCGGRRIRWAEVCRSRIRPPAPLTGRTRTCPPPATSATSAPRGPPARDSGHARVRLRYPSWPQARVARSRGSTISAPRRAAPRRATGGAASRPGRASPVPGDRGGSRRVACVEAPRRRDWAKSGIRPLHP